MTRGKNKIIVNNLIKSSLRQQTLERDEKYYKFCGKRNRRRGSKVVQRVV